MIVLAMVAGVESLRLPVGVLRVPQSGFWPLLLAIILLCLSLIYLLVNLNRGNNSNEDGHFGAQSGERTKIILVVGVLFTFAFFFEYLGHLISVFLLIVFLLQVIVRMKWWLVITIALLSSVLSYILLYVLLGAPLPAGLLKI